MMTAITTIYLCSAVLDSQGSTVNKRLMYQPPRLRTPFNVTLFSPLPLSQTGNGGPQMSRYRSGNEGADGADLDEEGSFAWKRRRIDMLVVVGLEASVCTTWNVSLHNSEGN